MKIDVATTHAEHLRGLLGKTNFKPLLFVYRTSEPRAMHMANMKASLDIFWISDEGRIIRVYRRVPPNDRYVYPSGSPVLYAIEAPPGLLPYRKGKLLNMEAILRTRSLPE
jgi:uncharacterized membrane protein (UPF0127 family)